MKIVAIVGSPRLHGNTNYLVDQALQEAAACGMETEKIVLAQHRLNPCLGHDNCASLSACQQDDDATWILDKFSSADGIILGSPVYFYNISAQMKAFVDRNVFFFRHNKRIKALCAGLIIVAGGVGIEETIGAFKGYLNISANIPGDRILTVTGYATKPGEVKTNSALIQEARKLGRRMAEILSSPSTASP